MNCMSIFCVMIMTVSVVQGSQQNKKVAPPSRPPVAAPVAVPANKSVHQQARTTTTTKKTAVKKQSTQEKFIILDQKLIDQLVKECHQIQPKIKISDEKYKNYPRRLAHDLKVHNDTVEKAYETYKKIYHLTYKELQHTSPEQNDTIRNAIHQLFKAKRIQNMAWLREGVKNHTSHAKK